MVYGLDEHFKIVCGKSLALRQFCHKKDISKTYWNDHLGQSLTDAFVCVRVFLSNWENLMRNSVLSYLSLSLCLSLENPLPIIILSSDAMPFCFQIISHQLVDLLRVICKMKMYTNWNEDLLYCYCCYFIWLLSSISGRREIHHVHIYTIYILIEHIIDICMYKSNWPRLSI